MLNFKNNTDNIGDLQEWNINMNYSDMFHDACGKSFEKNKLFKELTKKIVPQPKKAYALYLSNIYYHNLPKTKNNNIPEQLERCGIKYGIQDNKDPHTWGINNKKITPGHYIDSASKEYNDVYFKQLQDFCEENEITNKVIDISKYGITEFKIKISFIHYYDKESNKNVECIKFALIIGSTNKEFLYIIVDCNGKAQECGPDDNTIDIIRKGRKDHIIYYFASNVANKLFFEKYEKTNLEKEKEKGRKLILCKLLSDLTFIIFSSDSDVVCSTDSYLRERCIKNKVPIITSETKNNITIFYFLPIQKDNYLESCKIENQPPEDINCKVLAKLEEMRGGGLNSIEKNSEHNIFANDSNKQNVKNYIDSYIINLNIFLKVSVFYNKYTCKDEAKIYINKLIDFLNGKVKNEIDKIETNQSIDKFNIEIMKWFPLDIIVETNDTIRETPDIFLPTNITKIFPELDDTIEGFNNKIPMSFKKLAVEEEIKIENNYSLKDILYYLSKNLTQYKDSDEVIQCKDMIEQLKLKEQIVPNDLFLLFNICIDNTFINEDIILFEYLLYICKYDIIETYTLYTALMQLTYIDGYYIYNYNIINDYVNSVKNNEYIYPGGLVAFKMFLSKIMNSKKNIEEKIETKPEPIAPSINSTVTKSKLLDNVNTNDSKKATYQKSNPYVMYNNYPPNIFQQPQNQLIAAYGGNKKNKNKTKKNIKVTKKNYKKNKNKSKKMLS
jgi:hypothetical protein